MFRNKFLSTVLMSLCMVLCVMFFSTLTVEAANGTLKMEEDGKFYYYEGNEWISDKYGYVEFDGSKFLVANGIVADYMNGLAQDPENEADWYFLSNGLAQTQYTGLVEYDGAWFYVSEGKSDTTINDYVEYDGGLFLVALGRIVKEHQGLAQDPNGDDWYYVADGQAQTHYTGLAGYDGEYFYVQQGKFQKDFSGAVEYDGAYFKIVEGQMTEQIYGQDLVLKTMINFEYSPENVCRYYSVTDYSDNNKIYQSTEYTGDGTKYAYFKYNDDGYLTHIYSYDENGKEILAEKRIYDANGNCIENYQYNYDGSIYRHVVAKFDSNNRIIEEEIYCNDSKILNVYEYDKAGNEIKYTSYTNDEKEPSGWSINEYDSNGNRVKSTNYNKEGNIDSVSLSKYNEKGYEIEYKYINGDEENGTLSYGLRYIYDENGVFVRNESLDSEGNVINSYVVNGNRGEYYNGDGNLLWYNFNVYLYK